MHLIRHGEESLEDLHEDVLRGIHLFVSLLAEHFDACIDQEYSENTEYPLKAHDQSRTREDKDAPQYQGAEDAPEQYFVLIFPLNTEEREQHQEYEQIIHRQRLLDDVTCQELHRHLV